MSTINFYLKNQKGIDLQTTLLKIYVRYRIGRNVDLKTSIKKEILFEDWDELKQKAKNRTHLNNSGINGLISNLRKHLEDYDKENTEKGYTPSYKEVREYYDSYFKTSSEEVKEYNLHSFIEEFINSDEVKKKKTFGTIKTYKTTQFALKDFNDNVYRIDFENINLDFYNDFVEWCESKNLSLNYIGKHIKTLKTFMSEAIEQGLTDNVQFKSKRFKVLKEDADNVYLNLEELNRIYQLDLSKNQRLDNIRDLFILGAFTGLRVSDYNNLSKDSIKVIEGVKMISVKTKKTSQPVSIPLHPIVDEILRKYEGNPPPKIPDQKINEKIKDICEDVGIDEVVYISKTIGGRKVDVKKYKFELVKTHTARRSFCTNAYLMGMQPMDIMTISGHKTEKAFLTYIKRTPEQTAIKMSEHPFFKNQLKVV